MSATLTPGWLLPHFDHSQVVVYACHQPLLVLLLTPAGCSVLCNPYALSASHHWCDNVTNIASVQAPVSCDPVQSQHPGTSGGERCASSSIGRIRVYLLARSATFETVWRQHTLPEALRLFTFCMRMAQQGRGSRAHSKEVSARQPGSLPGRSACVCIGAHATSQRMRLHWRTYSFCSTVSAPDCARLQYTVPLTAALSLARANSVDACAQLPSVAVPAREAVEAANKQLPAINAPEKCVVGSHCPCQHSLQLVQCCPVPFKRSTRRPQTACTQQPRVLARETRATAAPLAISAS